MTKKQLRKELILLAKSYKVKLVFSANLSCAGWAHLGKDLIVVSSKKRYSKTFTISTVCHEICHILNKRDRKFWIYHNPQNWEDRDYPPGFMATAHRAEMYTEKRGKILMKKHYPGMKYIFTYFNTKASRRRIHLYLDPSYDSN